MLILPQNNSSSGVGSLYRSKNVRSKFSSQKIQIEFRFSFNSSSQMTHMFGKMRCVKFVLNFRVKWSIFLFIPLWLFAKLFYTQFNVKNNIFLFLTKVKNLPKFIQNILKCFVFKQLMSFQYLSTK